MSFAVVGVTTSFTLNAVTATQVGGINNGRAYLMITNNDPSITVYISFNSAATTGGIPIPPGGNYEIQVGKGQMQGSVWAISAIGNPIISYTEA